MSPSYPQLMISAYILAGGRSSRMGTDKALIELAGKPLIAHAATKLRRLTPNVAILSSNPALAPYAPLVPDVHPGTGPIGGIEAALLHTTTDWNLIFPVDVPFVPTVLLEWWAAAVIKRRAIPIRVALFSVDDVPQPTLLLVHRAAGPSFTASIAHGSYKLYPALEAAARELVSPNPAAYESFPYVLPIDRDLLFGTWRPAYPDPLERWQVLTPAQQAARPMWFSNLNRPEEVADARLHLDALDT